MIVHAAPDLPWLHRRWTCPDCGVVVEFTLDDLTGVGPVKPRLEQGRWLARKACPICHTVKIFREVVMGAGVDPVGRAVASSGSQPAAPTTEAA